MAKSPIAILIHCTLLAALGTVIAKAAEAFSIQIADRIAGTIPVRLEDAEKSTPFHRGSGRSDKNSPLSLALNYREPRALVREL